MVIQEARDRLQEGRDRERERREGGIAHREEAKDIKGERRVLKLCKVHPCLRK